MSVERPPAFTRHPDGSITVDRWTERILVSDELLAEAVQVGEPYDPDSPPFMLLSGDNLSFAVANGSATYRRVGRPEPGTTEFELLAGMATRGRNR